jgi:mitogen-activated protein kinase kinase kinase
MPAKKRHALSPSLYTHPERSSSIEEEEYDEGDWPSMSLSHTSSSSSGQRYGTRRLSGRTTSSGNASIPSNPGPTGTPHYADVYASFFSRYRKQPSTDDPKEDLNNHYFPRQLLDTGNSDDEDLSRVSITESISPLAESDYPQPRSSEDRERLEWQIMLASVIEGDVLKSEKTRIAVAMEQSAEEKKIIGQNIWLGIRARFHAVSPEEEMKRLEERRVRTVDPVIDEILGFCAEPSTEGDGHIHVLNQVLTLIRKLEAARALYPSLRAFHEDKPSALDKVFQARVDALSTWSTVYQTLRMHIAFIQKWTGSKTLDVLQPNTSGEVPIGSTSGRNTNGSAEIGDGSTFVERLLKEDSLQRTFEKGFLITIRAFIGTIRDAQVNMANIFKQMKLPSFENDLVPLVSFPTTLVQASLRVRLDYVQKLKDPEPLIIDQTIDDLKLSIGLACMLKRQYQVFLDPDPGGNWNLPQSIHEDYDSTILEGLAIFFRLLHWKLKSSNKSIYFKETDVLEAHWATFNDVSLATTGGSALVAEQLWYVFSEISSEISLLNASTVDWSTN